MTAFVGVRPLLRLALRRDRLMIPAWLVAVVGVVVGSYSAFAGLYPDAASRARFAAGIAANPTLRALTGVLYDATTIGGLTAWRTTSLGCVFLGLMSIFLVTRHTRAEEESGRLELVGSTAVGRRAPLTAAILTLLGADLVAGLLIAVGLIGQGAAAGSSFVLGAAIAGPAIVFGCVAAVTAQLSDSSRTANAAASSVLAVTFALRAYADSAGPDGPRWLSWVSPIGWGQQSRPFAGDRLWVLGGMVVAIALLIGVAAYLNGQRDLGAGVLPARPGPERAPRSLSGALGLSWRLQRTALAGWSVAFLLVGLAYGAIAPGIADFVSRSPEVEQILRQLGGRGGLSEVFLGATAGITALVASAYGVSAALRPRAEEAAGLAEPVLATATSRLGWLSSHLLFAFGGPALLLVLSALGSGVAYGLAGDQADSWVPRLVAAGMLQLPAVWTVVAAAVLLYGVVPRAATAAWAVLGAFVLIGQFGAALRLPQWLIDISPFGHVPLLPLHDISWTALAVVLLIAILGTIVGTAWFRRRDLVGG